MEPAILRARPADVEAINALIASAKRSLGYAAGYLDAALPLLRVDERYLAENLCFEARLDRIVAFAAVEPLEPGVVLLDHLWVEPDLQRRGLGRRLVAACLEAVRDDARTMRLYADPPSEGFYRRLGASHVGARPSRVPGGPVFPVLEFTW